MRRLAFVQNRDSAVDSLFTIIRPGKQGEGRRSDQISPGLHPGDFQDLNEQPRSNLFRVDHTIRKKCDLRRGPRIHHLRRVLRRGWPNQLRWDCTPDSISKSLTLADFLSRRPCRSLRHWNWAPIQRRFKLRGYDQWSPRGSAKLLQLWCWAGPCEVRE